MKSTPPPAARPKALTEHRLRQRAIMAVVSIELEARKPKEHRRSTRQDIFDVMAEEIARGRR